jgi:hypothetical protein
MIHINTWLTELCHDRCRMIVEFTTISTYHHRSREFEPRSWRGVLVATICDKVCQ